MILRLLLAMLLFPVVSPAAVDLLQRYPTQLNEEDLNPDHARAWDFATNDIVHLTQFNLAVGTNFQIDGGEVDLGIGHCSDGAIWALLIPRGRLELISSATNKPELISHVWLRFHPKE